jgi:hypothetical protein
VIVKKLVNKSLKNGRKHAIITGQNLKVAQQKEQFLWSLAHHHCLHLKAKSVFTFKTRFLFN